MGKSMDGVFETSVLPFDLDMSDCSAIAGYVLGFYPGVIRIWETFILDRCCGVSDDDNWIAYARKNKVDPWEVHESFKKLCPKLSNSPTVLLDDLDTALAYLVLSRTSHPDVIAELHHIWDVARESCEHRAACVQRDDRGARNARVPRWRIWDRLVQDALRSGKAADWLQVGRQMAEQLYKLSDEDWFRKDLVPLDFSSVDNDLSGSVEKRLALLEQARKEYTQAFDDGCCNGKPLEHKYTTLLGDLHEAIRRQLTPKSGGRLGKWLIVIDHRAKKIEFLGKTFTYKDFSNANASGGLKCFLVLASKPNEWVKQEDIIAGAALGAHKESLEAYFSRFRNVVKKAVDARVAQVDGEEVIRARRAYITKNYGIDQRKLDLDPRLVRHVK